MTLSFIGTMYTNRAPTPLPVPVRSPRSSRALLRSVRTSTRFSSARSTRAAVHLPTTEPGAVPYFTRLTQLAFTLDALLPSKLKPPSESPDADTDKDNGKGRYTLGPVREEMYDDVLAGSTIARTHDSLRAMPSGTAAVSDADGCALAWCFTLLHGAVGTLYVRPDMRKRALARATLGSELARALDSGRAVMLAEVAEGNGPSMGAHKAPGTRRIGEVVWARRIVFERSCERYRTAAAEPPHVH